MNQIIEDKVKLLPDSPGVYKMLDETGTVIYVGKAISLKNRVSQYFQKNKEHTPKVTAMVSHVADFETIGVHNEAEALSLESNLIKEFMPKYNILLRMTSISPMCALILERTSPGWSGASHPFRWGYIPWALSFRSCPAGAAFHHSQSVSHTALQKGFAEIHSTAGASLPYVSHRKMLRPLLRKNQQRTVSCISQGCDLFLEGHTEQVEASLKKQMWEASDKLDFEQAAFIRNRLQTVEKLQNHQAAIFPKEYEADVYAPARLEEDTLVYALFVRSGKIIGTEHYAMQARPEDTEEDILTAFLMQQYARPDNRPPKEILLPFLPTDEDAIADILNQRAGRRVYLLCPQRGDKVRLIEMAQKMGMNFWRKKRTFVKKHGIGMKVLWQICPFCWVWRRSPPAWSALIIPTSWAQIPFLPWLFLQTENLIKAHTDGFGSARKPGGMT